jgi:Zn-dependent protease with chaperone function
MLSFQGEFMDGRSATVRSVVITFDGLFLIGRSIDEDREVFRWELGDVSADGSQERDVVHLQFAAEPDALLTLRADEAIAEIRRLGLATRGLPRQAGRKMTLALALIAGIAMLTTLIWVSVTPLSRSIAHRVPLEVERDLLGGIEERLAESYCNSAPAAAALAQLNLRLLGDESDLPPAHILNLEIPNAFALPGGKVVLTRGLTALAEGPDEIAGVLAHELEHVRQRHVMAGFVRGTLLSTLWAVSVGDYAGLMVIDPSTAFQIATLEFSRDDEAEADAGALAMLQRAHIDSEGFARFFERLEGDEGNEIPEWMSSHPASGQRAAAAASGLEAEDSQPALSDEQWLAVQHACDEAPAPAAELRDLFF